MRLQRGGLRVAIEDEQSVGTSLTGHEVQGELGRELGGDCVPGSEGGRGSDQSKRGGGDGGKKEMMVLIGDVDTAASLYH